MDGQLVDLKVLRCTLINSDVQPHLNHRLNKLLKKIETTGKI